MSEVSTEPAGDLVERVAIALWVHEASRAAPNVAKYRNAETWQTEMLETERAFYRANARAAIAAMPDRAALEATLRLSNDLLEQFRKSDLEELTTLRTQLAASQADVARLRDALRPLADRMTTAEVLANPDHAWSEMGPYQRIEKMAKARMDRDTEILAARAAIKDTQI